MTRDSLREKFHERDVRETASWIVLNPGYLTFLRSLKGRTLTDLAGITGIAETEISKIESGSLDVSLQTIADIARQYSIPPEDIDDDYMYYDPDDHLKGGPIGRRDKWYGKRPRRYKRWFHRKVKPHLDPDESNRLGKDDHDRFEKEWEKDGKPDVYEIEKPKEE
jgi:transcriptional regulator with XRE-family HTH domain